MSELSPKIHSDIVAAYGDILNPNWKFVALRHSLHPYKELLDELSDAYSIVNTTDIQYDWALTLSLRRPGTQIGLRLSYVGPYALITDSTGHILDPLLFKRDSELKGLSELLGRHGVQLLDSSQVKEQLPFGQDRTLTSLYAILFSDDEADRL